MSARERVWPELLTRAIEEGRLARMTFGVDRDGARAAAERPGGGWSCGQAETLDEAIEKAVRGIFGWSNQPDIARETETCEISAEDLLR